MLRFTWCRKRYLTTMNAASVASGTSGEKERQTGNEKRAYLLEPFPRLDPIPLLLETLLPTEGAPPPPPLPLPPLLSIVSTTRSMSSVARSRQAARRGSMPDTWLLRKHTAPRGDGPTRAPGGGRCCGFVMFAASRQRHRDSVKHVSGDINLRIVVECRLFFLLAPAQGRPLDDAWRRGWGVCRSLVPFAASRRNRQDPGACPPCPACRGR